MGRVVPLVRLPAESPDPALSAGWVAAAGTSWGTSGWNSSAAGRGNFVVSVVIPELDAEFGAGPSADSSVTGDPFHIPTPATPAGVPPPAAAGLDGHPLGEEFL